MLFSIIALMNNYLEIKNAKYLKESNETKLMSKSLNPQLGGRTTLFPFLEKKSKLPQSASLPVTCS